MTKKSLLFTAPSTTMSGYAVHSRQIARWLFERHTDKFDITTENVNWGMTPWITDISDKNGLIRKLYSHATNKKPFYDIQISCKLPNEWNPMLARFNVGITAGVETDKCNPQWIQVINRMDMVIVPSQFVKDTFLNSGEVKKPIVVVPESFPDELLNDSPESIDLSSMPDFNFLIVGQMTGNNPDNERKHTAYTLKWLNEIFSDNPNVGIILKTNFARNTHLDRWICKNTFSKLLKEIGVKQGGPKFSLLHGHLTDGEMNGLYRHPKVKALVSLSRNEGYGLPILESAAVGLPVITTNHSGPMDFLQKGKYIGVDFHLEPIHETRIDNQIFMEGAKWAKPSEMDAKKSIKKFYDKSFLPKEWAEQQKEYIVKNYSFSSIADKYDIALKNIL